MIFFYFTIYVMQEGPGPPLDATAGSSRQVGGARSPTQCDGG